MRATDRDCLLVHPGDKPLRAVVAQLRNWIVEEMKSDVAAVDSLYSSLQLRRWADGDGTLAGDTCAFAPDTDTYRRTSISL